MIQGYCGFAEILDKVNSGAKIQRLNQGYLANSLSDYQRRKTIAKTLLAVAIACSITMAPIAFGAYDSVLKAQSDTTGSLTVICTNGASTFVKLGQGLSTGGGSTDAVPVRRMTNGTNFLPYSLSTVVDQSVVWEMTTGVAHAGTGIATVLTVYGRIAAGVNVPAGTYAGTVVARVTF